MKNKLGFTLAEVLITLAIIGVVAALTIPTLLTNYEKQATVTKLKKAYAEITESLKLAEVEYGPMGYWEFSNMGTTEAERKEFFTRNYVAKNLHITQFCKPNEDMSPCIKFPILDTQGNPYFGNPQSDYAFVTTSGYSVHTRSGGVMDKSIYPSHSHIIIDIDGPNKGKNKMGRDIFDILIYFGDNWSETLNKYPIKLKGNIGTKTRDELLEMCKTTDPTTCGAVIQADDWKISDDYPW